MVVQTTTGTVLRQVLLSKSSIWKKKIDINHLSKGSIWSFLALIKFSVKSKARYYSHCSFYTRHNIAYFRTRCKTWSSVYSMYIPPEGLLIDQVLAYTSGVWTIPKTEANTLDFEALRRGPAVLREVFHCFGRAVFFAGRKRKQALKWLLLVPTLRESSVHFILRNELRAVHEKQKYLASIAL